MLKILTTLWPKNKYIDTFVKTEYIRKPIEIKVLESLKELGAGSWETQISRAGFPNGNLTFFRYFIPEKVMTSGHLAEFMFIYVDITMGG